MESQFGTLGITMALARISAGCQSNPVGARQNIFTRVSFHRLMPQASRKTCNSIPSLSCGLHMINELHNILPENIRQLQSRKVTSLEEAIVSPYSRKEGLMVLPCHVP